MNYSNSPGHHSGVNEVIEFYLEPRKDTAPLVGVTHETAAVGVAEPLQPLAGAVHDGLVGEAQLVGRLDEAHAVAPHVQQHLQHRPHVIATQPTLQLGKRSIKKS